MLIVDFGFDSPVTCCRVKSLLKAVCSFENWRARHGFSGFDHDVAFEDLNKTYSGDNRLPPGFGVSQDLHPYVWFFDKDDNNRRVLFFWTAERLLSAYIERVGLSSADELELWLAARENIPGFRSLMFAL